MDYNNSFCYEIMKLVFGNSNIYDGLRNALYFITKYTGSLDAILYQKDIDNSFQMMSFNSNSESMDFNNITSILNRIEKNLTSRDYINFDVQIDSSISRIVYLKIIVDDNIYVLALPNMQKNMNNKVFDLLKEVLGIIISKVKKYEQMLYDSNIDLLTGINNRNLYEKQIKYLDNINCQYVYALFDLFRLKYVNDNYGHLAGDMYIIKTAEVLKKYFPQYQYITDSNGKIIKADTGSSIYRIGGDEFALIDQSNSIELINDRVQLVRKEVEDLDLGIKDKIVLGINYGVSYHGVIDNIKDVSVEADKMLRDDKTKMYKKLGIDRRSN